MKERKKKNKVLVDEKNVFLFDFAESWLIIPYLKVYKVDYNVFEESNYYTH